MTSTTVSALVSLAMCVMLLAGCGDDTSPAGPTEEAFCETAACVRLIACVSSCDGPVVSSGCCPCPEGQLDRDFDCPPP